MKGRRRFRSVFDVRSMWCRSRLDSSTDPETVQCTTLFTGTWNVSYEFIHLDFLQFLLNSVKLHVCAFFPWTGINQTSPEVYFLCARNISHHLPWRLKRVLIFLKASPLHASQVRFYCAVRGCCKFLLHAANMSSFLIQGGVPHQTCL